MRVQAAVVLWAGLGVAAFSMAAPLAARQNQAYQSQDQNNQDQTNVDRQIRQIRQMGYNAGFRDGVNDSRGQAQYDFRDHDAYKDATIAANSDAYNVDPQTFRMDFRTGYEAGYDDGYNGRTDDASARRDRNYQRDSGNYQAGGYGAAQPSRRADIRSAGVLPAGTALDLQLNNTLSTRSSEQGDRFTATVSAPVYSRDGQTLLVPQGSIVQGTVEGVQRSGGISGNSQLQLNFERLRLPDGQSLPLRADLTNVDSNSGVGGAITGRPSATNEGGVERSQTRSTVGTAAAGGAVGAIIGALAGGGKGAGIGGLVGAGLGVVLSNHNGGALDLPAGTPMTITLSRPVRVQ